MSDRQVSLGRRTLYGFVVDSAVWDYLKRVVTGDRDSITGILRTGVITPEEELEYFGDLLLAQQALKTLEGT